MIETPPKIWRPKPPSKYIPLDYADDIDEGLFEVEDLGGKTVFKPTKFQPVPARHDIITFGDEDGDEAELEKHFKLGASASPESKSKILRLVQKYWDCFCKRGARRTIIGYEFGVDTGASKPVCCRVRQYGHHESRIMMEQIEALLKNDWIEEAQGAWGSMIVLAPKPHQEHVTDIDDFIWRMCVSYRGLNSVTKPFAWPIPRCDDAIGSLNFGSGTIYIITVDARQGYHQVAVKASDKEKLAFFAPNNKKYTYTVMPFGPMNAPAFYTYMMQKFKDEWDALFYQTLRQSPTLDTHDITVTTSNQVTLDNEIVQTGSKGIIDDILIWSTALPTVLAYFECVCQVFQKYRVSFRLDKCEFLKERVEYVGHDLTPVGNCPAASKFDMIRDWKLPTNGQSLHSFVGLVNFYHNYIPYFEIRVKPLRALHRRYNRKPIPHMAWSAELIALFQDLKLAITSSPVLVRYDPDQPLFLKTDWSSDGMGWILLQPAGDKESQQAAKTLLQNGECLFDLTKSGARLQPVVYGSRACTESERFFHSFVGEAAAGRWAISQNKRYLWGNHFYWMCDCTAVKEILEYNGSIHMIMRWAQELLGYHFTIIHRLAAMMADVDALTRRFGAPISTYISVAAILRQQDATNRPIAYEPQSFTTASKSTKVKPSENTSQSVPILTNALIQSTDATQSHPSNIVQPPHELISSTPTLIASQLSLSCSIPPQNNFNTLPRPCHIAEAQYIQWITINDCAQTVKHWTQNNHMAHINWSTEQHFTHPKLNALSLAFQLPTPAATQPLAKLLDPQSTFLCKAHFLDIVFTPYTDGNIHEWFHLILFWLASSDKKPIVLINFWISYPHVDPTVLHAITSTVSSALPSLWDCKMNSYSLPDYDVPISSGRFCFHFFQKTNSWQSQTPPTNQNPTTFEACIQTDLNTDYNACPLIIPSSIFEKPPITTHHPQPIVHLQAHDNNTNISTQCSNILDFRCTVTEPNLAIYNDLLGHRFGIPFQNSIGTWTTRRVSTQELARAYTLPFATQPAAPCSIPIEAELDYNFTVCIPMRLLQFLVTHEGPVQSIIHQFLYTDDEFHTTAHCLTISSQPAPQTLDWTTAYGEDPDTSAMAQLMIQFGHSKQWPTDQLKTINTAYHEPLKAGLIQHMRKKFVYFKPILINTKYIGLIIVPEGLRRALFSHYHAGPTGGHMGEYKTLYRLRSRFFWPGMRQNIKDWVKGCAHCVAQHAWRTRRSELYFSWPVTVPFWIMHVDLWSPGHTQDHSGQKGYLLNAMCDLTQFVVSIPVTDITAASLAQIYMEQVILTFGISAVVVVDDGSTFKGAFRAMCESLKLTFWTLSKNNHQGLSVERYHRFLNKTQTITGNDRGTHITYLQNAKTSQYAWNSAPIDGTDIPRSLAAVGREFKFPLDVELCPSPPLNDQNNSALTTYLRTVSNDSAFATSVLQIIIEERRTEHRNRHNKTVSKLVEFKVGDVVKAHVQVQSQSATGQVGKLSYKARGPFQISKVLGHGAYEVQKYNDPSSTPRKYKSTELYLLPPALFPSDPLDTTDQRYLNYEHAPIPHPLQKPLQIELYNDKYFTPPPQHLHSPSTNRFTIPSDQIALATPHIPTNQELHHNTGSTPHAIEIDANTCDQNPTTTTTIANSQNKLFFIKYTPSNTLRARWYLIQVDPESTATTNPDFKSNGRYYCTFLAKHPSDNHKSDEFSRFWPDWYKYTKDKNGIISYGCRTLFAPHINPDHTKYIEWATEIQLHDRTNILLGPFDFEKITTTNRTRQKVHHDQWVSCHEQCLDHNLVPPTLGSQSHVQPLPHRTRQKRNRRS